MPPNAKASLKKRIAPAARRLMGVLAGPSPAGALLAALCAAWGLGRCGPGPGDYALSLSNSVVSAALFLALFLVFRALPRPLPRRLFAFSALGGVALSGMLVAGRALCLRNTSALLSPAAWLTAAFAALGLGGLVCLALSRLTPLVAGPAPLSPPGRAQGFFSGGPRYFFVMWGVIFLCYVPALLAAYPGVYGYDSVYQMRQMLQGNLNAHHPVLHTLYLYGCVMLGENVFQSRALGMLLYSLTQMLIMAASLAYACNFMAKRRAPPALLFACAGFFALLPVNAMFAVSATKDVLFACCMVLLTLFTAGMAQNPREFFSSRGLMLRYALAAFFMMALRNNGVYIFIAAAPFLIFTRAKAHRLPMAAVIGCAIAAFALYTGPVYKLMGVSPGDTREALSVPIQQLARAAMYNPGELTAAQHAAIRALIPQESLAAYNPSTADPVKNSFKTDVLKADPAKYIKLWLAVGIKCPKSYLLAFLYNNYGFWYPDMPFPDPLAWHPYMEFKNTALQGDYFLIPTQSKAPRLLEFYQAIAYGTAHQGLPVIAMLFSPGFYFWALALCMLAMLYYKKYSLLPAPLLLFFLWATTLFGPVVLMRYAFPLTLCLPGVLSLLFPPALKHTQHTQHT